MINSVQAMVKMYNRSTICKLLVKWISAVIVAATILKSVTSY